MSKILLFFVLLLVAAVGVNAQTIQFTEDWETGPTSWTVGQYGPNWYMADGGTVITDITAPHGTKVLQVPNNGSGSHMIWLLQNQPTNSDYYTSWNQRFTSGTNLGSTTNFKFSYVRGNQDTSHTCYYDGQGQGTASPYLRVICDGQADSGYLGPFPITGGTNPTNGYGWHHLEEHRSASIYQMWYDGVLLASVTSGAAASTGSETLSFGVYCNDVCSGTTYLDNIQICTGGRCPAGGGGGGYAPPDIWVNTGEFSDMRAGLGTGSVHIQSGEGFSTSLYTGYLDDTLIGGSNTPLSPLNSPSLCHGGNWCYSGSFNSAGSHWINAAYTAPGQTAMSFAPHQFFRCYLKFPANATMGPPGCLGKIMYLRNSNSPAQTLQFDQQGRASGSGMNVYFEYGSDSALSPSAIIPFDGNWHYVEVELNTSTSSPHQRAWIDNPTTPAIDWSYQFQAANNWYPNFEITFGPYINPSGNAGCTSFSNATVYVDDMAESTQRIGPTGAGSAPSPPSPPANLTAVVN